MESSRLKDIYKNLKDDKIDVYLTGQHIGDCIKPYVVVKKGAVTKMAGYSTLINYFDLLCYVPKNQQTKIDEYIKAIRKSMLKISPMIKFNTTTSEPYFDESVQGFMVDLEYINYSKYNSEYYQKYFENEKEE